MTIIVILYYTLSLYYIVYNIFYNHIVWHTLAGQTSYSSSVEWQQRRAHARLTTIAAVATAARLPTLEAIRHAYWHRDAGTKLMLLPSAATLLHTSWWYSHASTSLLTVLNKD